MRPIATDGVAWSVCVSVCLLVTFVSDAKTAEPIEISFVMQRNHVLYWGRDSLTGKRQFWGLCGPLKSLVVSAAVYAAKRIIQSSIIVTVKI